VNVGKLADWRDGPPVENLGSSLRNRDRQYFTDRLVQANDLAVIQRSDQTRRMELGEPETLVDINVAEPGDDTLVQKRGLERGSATPAEPSPKGLQGELVTERVRPERQGGECRGKLVGKHELDAGEVTDIGQVKVFIGGEIQPESGRLVGKRRIVRWDRMSGSEAGNVAAARHELAGQFEMNE
jgi:hypothetical protein